MQKKGFCLLAAALLLALCACGQVTIESEPASAVQSEASAPESTPDWTPDERFYMAGYWMPAYYTRFVVAQNGVRHEIADYREQCAYMQLFPYVFWNSGMPGEAMTYVPGAPEDVLPGYQSLPSWASYTWGCVSPERRNIFGDGEVSFPERFSYEFYFGAETTLLVLRQDDKTACYTGSGEPIAAFFADWDERFAAALEDLVPDTRSVDSPEVLEALVSDGFPREATAIYLKHLAGYHSHTAEDVINAHETNYPDWYLEEQVFISECLRKNWTKAEMSIGSVKATGGEQYVVSADGTKYIFTAVNGAEYLCFGHTFWHDTATGETKLLACETGGTWFFNDDDGILVLISRGYTRAFDINTGERADDRAPRFDFGQEARRFGTERILVGGGYDSASGCCLYLFEKEFGDAGENERAVWFDVFDRSGKLIREASAGLRVPQSIKSFYLYADPVLFHGGLANIHFFDTLGTTVSYLADDPADLPEALRPVAVDPAELCALLEGVWKQDAQDACARFAFEDGSPTYKYWAGAEEYGPAGIIESAEKRGETEYHMTVRFPDSPDYGAAHTQELWADTGAPKDNRIRLNTYYWSYEDFTYLRDNK